MRKRESSLVHTQSEASPQFQVLMPQPVPVFKIFRKLLLLTNVKVPKYKQQHYNEWNGADALLLQIGWNSHPLKVYKLYVIAETVPYEIEQSQGLDRVLMQDWSHCPNKRATHILTSQYETLAISCPETSCPDLNQETKNGVGTLRKGLLFSDQDSLQCDH